MSTQNLTLAGACAGTFVAGLLAGSFLKAAFAPQQAVTIASPVAASVQPNKAAPQGALFEDKLPVTDSESEDEEDDGANPYKLVRLLAI